MARLPRLFKKDCPQYLIQRDNFHQAVCSGLLIPDTILGGTMTSTEVFNDKTKKKFYS